MDEDLDGDLADLENLNYDDLDSVSKLQQTQRYLDVMQVCFMFVSIHLIFNCLL